MTTNNDQKWSDWIINGGKKPEINLPHVKQVDDYDDTDAQKEADDDQREMYLENQVEQMLQGDE